MKKNVFYEKWSISKEYKIKVNIQSVLTLGRFEIENAAVARCYENGFVMLFSKIIGEIMNENFTLAKREYNPKRDFIIVNKFQSKHYPSDPRETVLQCQKLGASMAEVCPRGECLVIAFSETAVGIGSLAALQLGSRCFLISTTREELPEYFERITFEESHSHAPLHSLCIRTELDFGRFSRVFIIDDEYTTGNTAIALYKAIRGRFDCPVTAAAFIASEESRRNFSEHNIGLIAGYGFEALGGAKFPRDFLEDRHFSAKNADLDIALNAVYDVRLGVNYSEYYNECERLCRAVSEKISEFFGNVKTVEIVGTEEFCMPPVILGKILAEKGLTVRVHGITRSPVRAAAREDYPIKNRAVLRSLYDPERKVYLYNYFQCDLSIIMTDADNPDSNALLRLCGAVGGQRTALVRWRGKTMQTSLNDVDCRLLLKDITNCITPMLPEEREPLIHNGVHYCELLPAEYEPSEEYIRLYKAGLAAWSRATAEAVRAVAEKIYLNKGRDVAIVSLARAGTPVGVLVKRYLKRFYGFDAAHYSVSIIRGRGIDQNALRYILARHSSKNIQFIDGWTGKGAIIGQLTRALEDFPEIDKRLAVLADPAGLCEIYGTRGDLFIPCSCLNSVVSGLFSRTVLRSDVIGEEDFHGAAYFGELAAQDRTYEFIAAVESEFDALLPYRDEKPAPTDGAGAEETVQIAQKFGVSDINLIKPSIGEATRVLLRRTPRLILVRSLESPLTSHLVELAREKNVPVYEYPLKCYNAAGIIKDR